MDEQTFSVLHSALEEINDISAMEELSSIKDRIDKGNYFVAFIGQYSAGKSTLINNLLGRKVLPGGRVETTPILTYISYNSQESGRLFYLDGNVEDIDIATVMEITQSNSESRKLDEIEHMEIFLNEPILADGMILLDTPGINTLIRRHEQLLANSLSIASSIIYVVGGAPSRVDIEKLQDFASHGFKLSFVRTHCDEINEWEESYRQVVSSDKSVLKDCDLTDSLDDIFFVSNLETSKYFGEVERIRELLREKGKSVNRELEIAMSARIQVIAGRAIKELKELRKTLSQKKYERDSTVELQRKKIDSEIARLNNVLQERRRNLQSAIAACQSDLDRELNHFAQNAGDNIAKSIESAGDEIKTNTDMEDFVRRKMRPIFNRAFEIINFQISPILNNINSDLKFDIDAGIVDADALIEDLPEIESYSEVVNYQDTTVAEIRRKIMDLQKNRENLQLQLNTTNDANLQNDLIQLENDLIVLTQERSELGNFTPRMIQVDSGNSSGAQIGRTIGNILDLATLLLPNGAVTKVATKTGLLSKIAKVPAQVVKGFKGLVFGEKVTKTYATAKRLETAKNFILQANQKINTVKEIAPVSFLDYLTLAHWGEKLGSQFDSPPRYEEDLSYRRDYFEKKRQIEQNILRKQQELYRRKESLGAFKTEQERKAAKLASLDVDEQELNRQLKSQEEKIRQESKRNARQQWKHQWAEHYRNALPTFLLSHTKQHLADLPARLEEYQAQRFATLEDKLAEKKSEYDSLTSMREDEISKKLKRIDNVLSQLESAGYR